MVIQKKYWNIEEKVGSERFDLNAGSGALVLESGTPSLTLNNSSAFLRVGTVTSIDSGSTNRGVYMEGDGDVLIKAGPKVTSLSMVNL